MYHICPNFRGAQFSRIAISKRFMETIIADREFRVYDILKFRELNYHRLLGSAKTDEITCLENLDVFGRQESLHLQAGDDYCVC